MPKIDIAAVPQRKGSGYPPPFDAPCAERVRQRLGNAGGLTDFGVNLMRLPPGNWSSQRHWHSAEDEFVYVLEGELTLTEDGGETVLRAGDCAAFAKGSGNGHHLINRSGAMAVYLEVGARSPADVTICSDIDMMSNRRPVRAQGWHALSRALDEYPPQRRVPGADGAYAATGHSVWGMLNAPATGEAMTELTLDGTARHVDLAPFAPGRLRAHS